MFKIFLVLLLSFNVCLVYGEVVNKIIAVVNAEPILQTDLTALAGRLKKEGSVDESLLLGEPLSTLKQDRQAQLNYLINEKLIESEIKKQNLSVTEDRVNSEMATMAKRNQMSRADLEAAIKTQGFSLSEYKKNLKLRLERQSFFENEIVSKLRITDEDAYSEFRQRNPNYRPNVTEFTIAQIFFDPKNGGGKGALVRAQAVEKKLDAGEAFESLADTYSETKGAESGGLLGSFKSGEFIPEIEKKISGLEAGQLSGIVQSKKGFHIFKILDRKLTVDPQFLKYKEQLKAVLVEKNFKRQLKNWLESKKQDAYIKIN